ncbi:MAG: hypothetical protein ACRD1T_20080 [Acidimicrobiia bacterium]
MSDQATGRETELRRYRRVRALICLLSLGILIGAVVYQGIFPGGLIVVLLLGGVPLLGYVAWVRTALGSIVGGAALLILVVGSALYVTARIDAGSSTAALGYLSLLFVGVPILLVTLFIEMVVRGRSPHSEP